MFKSFKRTENRKKKRKPEIWNPRVLLDRITRMGNNERMKVRDLQKKTICLCILFSACRFTELERVNVNHSTTKEEAIELDTTLKTGQDRTDIIIPFLNETPLIWPASTVKELWKRSDEEQEKVMSLFVDEITHKPLTARVLRSLAAELMRDAGIPEIYSPYTLKHASLSTLTSAGIPVGQIAKFARLSPSSNTITKHYVRKNFATNLAQVIAGQTPDTSKGYDEHSDSDELSDSESSEQEEEEKRKEMESLELIKDKPPDEQNTSTQIVQYNTVIQSIDEVRETPGRKPDKIEEPEDTKEMQEGEELNEATKKEKGWKSCEWVKEQKIKFVIRTRAQMKMELEKKSEGNEESSI
ncbi:uncharacterized protein MONOS_4414 [Monocercomonoides exilis]|uniref:uncharacterized protein n=1 Tax=Monocercomonoides exilis TaxID=2049356 RepID=UPI00355AC516|nr:hypothetical protein MONOS_4414 [Monocercomonoides exilis]|eukprot:MONOS_4414.1-p1 / transcript=MONOS_4414.1 / gene=MONOS_4414 / organism=Monocercomonoides_exilis_PA203 / gene_product=unspecified product / transcript_product=unspecified product / location=Mono_scaffold00117:62101-63165(+) / protein_length=354 / sequence_SO=supercontig / SO=protein_coding / is_pseudo=false